MTSLRPVGVARVVTYVNPENRASLALLRRLGPLSVTRAGPGASQVVVELGPVPTASATVDDSPVTPCA